MPMDGLTVGFAARELNEMLRGGRIDKITQPERDAVVLVIRAGGANHRLLLCASPNNARCHLTMGSFSNPLEPPALCMLMRKQLTGARITEIRQVGGDRVVYVDMDAVNELGDHVLRRLVLEIMGRHSNLLLLDENDRILEATRHVNMEMSRVRQIQPGMTYLPPPAQDKLDPATVTGEMLYERLRNSGSTVLLKRALADTITGLSRVSAEELACRVLHGGEEWPADLKDACDRLADLLGRLPAMADARVLFSEDGEAADVFAFPYLSERTDSQRPYKTLSEALDVYFGTRDARDRLNQKSASMVRMLKGQLERCQRKLAIQTEELASAGLLSENARKLIPEEFRIADMSCFLKEGSGPVADMCGCGDDEETLRELFRMIEIRAGKMTSALVAAVIKRIKENGFDGPVPVAVNGSTVLLNELILGSFTEGLRRYAGENAFRIVTTENDTLFGSAAAAFLGKRLGAGGRLRRRPVPCEPQEMGRRAHHRVHPPAADRIPGQRRAHHWRCVCSCRL